MKKDYVLYSIKAAYPIYYQKTIRLSILILMKILKIKCARNWYFQGFYNKLENSLIGDRFLSHLNSKH